MATQVQMPKLGLTMKEGTLVKWLKSEGDFVAKGEPLFEVLTEKINIVVESPGEGVLRKILVPPGTKVPVGTVLAIIAQPDEELPEIPVFAPPPPEAAAPKVKASPRARRLAEELGVDLALVRGTGPDGRITEEDVRRAAEEGVAARVAVGPGFQVLRTVPYSGMRAAIGQRLQASHLETVPVTIVMEVDVQELLELRRKLNESLSKREEISVTAFLVLAAAKALLKHPRLNARLVGENIEELADVHIGVAVALEDGLIVPVIRHADKKSLHQISQEIRLLSRKAQRGELSPDEASGSTFTITNLGMYGVDWFTPIINPPETAILGVGRTRERPVVVDGAVGVRSFLNLCLTFDHRILDGAPAAQFLATLKEYLENPYTLLI